MRFRPRTVTLMKKKKGLLLLTLFLSCFFPNNQRGCLEFENFWKNVSMPGVLFCVFVLFYLEWPLSTQSPAYPSCQHQKLKCFSQMLHRSVTNQLPIREATAKSILLKEKNRRRMSMIIKQERQQCFHFRRRRRKVWEGFFLVENIDTLATVDTLG